MLSYVPGNTLVPVETILSLKGIFPVLLACHISLQIDNELVVFGPTDILNIRLECVSLRRMVRDSTSGAAGKRKLGFSGAAREVGGQCLHIGKRGFAGEFKIRQAPVRKPDG